MKNTMIKSLQATLCLLFITAIVGVSFVSAQNAEETKSLLWKIEGKGIKTSYLFGTIHIAPKTDVVLSEAALKALSESKRLVFELDFDDPNLQAGMMKYVMMKDGNSIDKLMSAEDYAMVDNSLQNAAGVKLEMVKGMQPFFLISMLMPILIEQPLGSYEMTVLEKAPKGIEVLGLETIEEQMAAVATLEYKKQAEMLVQMLKDLPKSKKTFSDMLENYKAQDIEALRKAFDEGEEWGGSSKDFLDDRNIRWIDRIKKAAKDKNTFFAVGSGHLGGEKGVIALLRAKGFKVTAVK